jgi:hypothetical protein
VPPETLWQRASARPGAHARLDQPRHAVDERPRLPRPRPRDDEQRAFGRRHRLELRRVQLPLVIYPARARQRRDASQHESCSGLRGRRLPQFEVAFEGPQFGGEFAGRLVAELRRAGERLRQDAQQFGRELRPDVVAQPRLLVEDGVHRVYLVVAREGARARQHLAEDDAEGEEVAAAVDALAEQLLGRHVVDRPQNGARLRLDADERLLRAVGGARGLRARDELGDAEVENLDVAVAADHQVLRLQVAVDDARLVRLRQPFGYLDGKLQRLDRLQGARTNLLPQRLALDVLHRHVGAATVFAELVDGEDVRVAQDGGGARLLQEAAAAVFVRGELRRQ